MNQTPNGLWLSFQAFAKTYPHDNGVRITARLGSASKLIECTKRVRSWLACSGIPLKMISFQATGV
jgi:hypothetical protein